MWESETDFCLFVLHSCSLQFEHCMVLTYIRKTRHSMLFVTDMYLRDITNTMFSILYVNVSPQHLLLLIDLCFVGDLRYHIQ